VAHLISPISFLAVLGGAGADEALHRDEIAVHPVLRCLALGNLEEHPGRTTTGRVLQRDRGELVACAIIDRALEHFRPEARQLGGLGAAEGHGAQGATHRSPLASI
jgi:hypothetical protein